MGAHHRHTTPEMAARVVGAIQARLTIVVHIAEETVETHPALASRDVF
jgi:ribonuclease BN (tRNA processing enzyme)